MKRFSEFVTGDLLLTSWLDENNHMGMTLIPQGMRDRVKEKAHALKSLVQIHARGDSLPNGYGNGSTLACTSVTDLLHFVRQEREGDRILTTLADDRGRTVIHRAGLPAGDVPLRGSDRFVRGTMEAVTAMNLLTGDFDVADYQEILPKVEIREISEQG